MHNLVSCQSSYGLGKARFPHSFPLRAQENIKILLWADIHSAHYKLQDISLYSERPSGLLDLWSLDV